jgi:hypothetical protein
MQLDFDFHSSSARPGKLGIALALLGVLVLGWVWNTLQTARATEAGIALQIAAIEQEQQRNQFKPAVNAAVQIAQAGVAAQLAYSWQPAFDALAASHTEKIALVSLDAMQAKSQLKLVAEARQLADAVDFIDVLQQQPRVKRVTLTQHEVQRDADQQPVRFSILVELSG